MLLAAEVDGGRFRPAQFTRVTRDASFEAVVEPYEGHLRLQVEIRGRADGVEGLLRILHRDGARIEGSLHEDGFDGTCDLDVGPADEVPLHLAALRQASDRLRLRIQRGRIHLMGEVQEHQVGAWRHALAALDPGWSLAAAHPKGRIARPQHA